MVNIKEQESPSQTTDMLGAIYEQQTKLMEKYHLIEQSNGFYVPKKIPVNIDDAKCQDRLKNFAWRITEEVGEALEALDKMEIDHFHEELSDGLHFLVEFSIQVGYKPTSLEDLFVFAKFSEMFEKLGSVTEVYYRAGVFVRDLGITCNCLKNKPWKQSQMITDTDYFLGKLDLAWKSYVCLCYAGGVKTPEQLYDLYHRKAKVNEFRQRSQY